MTRSSALFKLAVAAVTVGATALCVGQLGVAAATKTANLSVTASVGNGCTITAIAVAFGVYDPIIVNAATALDATGSVTTTCTRDTVSHIGLGLGANASGSTRRMVELITPDDWITYELYTDSGRTTVWGNADPSWFTPPPAPSSAPRTFTIYGRVPPAQDVSDGNYADTVVATLNF